MADQKRYKTTKRCSKHTLGNKERIMARLSDDVLRIENLHAGYGELEILKGISLHIKRSEIVTLIGPNGAGKSTVLKSIFSLADIRRGSIILEGKEIIGLRTYDLIRKGVCFVNQGRVVFGNLSVEENLLLGARFERGKEKERLKQVFSEFPALLEKRKYAAATLSGGQRQMVCIGRALMQQPLLLLMDEPSLGLSPKLQKELFAIIASLRKRGIAVLLVEQNAKKAIDIADRTYLLEDGNIVLEGGKDIIRNKKIKSVYLGGR